MSEPLIDIRPDHWTSVADILRRHVPDREVWAFGSRATWNAKEYSDLDLAVIGKTPLSLSVSAALADDFAESDLPFKVDAVDWATTSESFRKIIERDKVVVQEGKGRSLGMAGEWSARLIEECVATLIDYRGKTPQKTSSGIPLITAKVVKGGRIQTPDEFISVDDYEPWMRRGIPKAGDVVITTEAPLGEVAQLGPERVALAQRLIAIRGKSGVLDNTFLKFLLQSEEVQNQLRARASGTTVFGIKQSELRKVLLTIPPIDTQRAIAHILGTLDDKIEFNRRMNETLEAMARALFRSWFVDFLPVRAKQRARTQTGAPVRAKQSKNVGWVSPSGRNPPDKADGGLRGYAANPPYELPPHIADLFPDRFVDSELGEIPKGWDMGTLGDVAKHPRRGVQPDKIDAATPYIALEHIPKRCIALSEWGVAKGLESNKFEFKRGEILFGKLRPYFHKVGVAPVDGVCSTDIVVVTPREEAWFGFMLGHVSSTAFVVYTNAGSTGTKMPRTSWSEMARYPVVIPPESVAQAFTTQIRPAVEHIIASIHESRTLVALRNALLPKLITGELRVPRASFGVETKQ